MNTHYITATTPQEANKLYQYYSKQGYELTALTANEYRMQRVFDRVAQMLIITIRRETK